jgi:threonine aldolase
MGANPHTALLMLENTHNRCSGGVLSLSETVALADVAHERGVPVHIDGARIFNAATALGVAVSALASPADSVTFCFSKGLGAPVGSILCGSAEFVKEARRLRRVIGGAMRQAGILAAAAIYSLERMVERLADDHANARLFADGLAASHRVRLDPAQVQTNIIVFGLAPHAPDATTVVAQARSRGVLLMAFGVRTIRAVTHLDVTREQCERAAGILLEIVDGAAGNTGRA